MPFAVDVIDESIDTELTVAEKAALEADLRVFETTNAPLTFLTMIVLASA